MSAASTRRLSLLTGSSVFAALLMAGGMAAAPTAALAANECGPSTGTQVCTGTHPEISYTTTGNLTLQLEGDLVVTTGGLVVVGAGTNTVTINRPAASAGDPSITSTSATNAALQVTRATAGGNIAVTLSDNDTDDTPLIISGVKGGVFLSNMGTSTTAFTTTNGTISASAGAGIELTTAGTGNLTLTNGSAVTGTTFGARLRNTGAGGGNVTATNNGFLTATAGAGLDLGTTGTGAISLNNNGEITGTTAAVSVANGNNVTVTNSGAGRLLGTLTFANTGTTTITNNNWWGFAGASTLRNTATATGSATLNNGVGGVIATNLDGAASSIDFGIGGATFNNAGRLAAGHGAEGAVTLVLSGLATWNNSGSVMFGADDTLFVIDGVANDRIVLSGPGGGATFLGSGDSRLVMDVDFSASQLNCSAAVTADCLDLRGQNTAGSTAVEINTVGYGFGAERIVLIDVGGVGTDAGAFNLSANSTGYRDAAGGLIDGGLFLYALEHDADGQQHVLEAVSVDGEAFELALLGRQVSEPWRTATGMWHDRQADLRNSVAGRAEGYAPGAWLKVAGSFIDESRVDTLMLGGDRLEFSTSYDQRTTAVVGGVDLLRFIGENSAWVLGLTAGKVDSKVEFDPGQSHIDLDGHSFGVYASVLAGPAFFDAILNTTNLDLIHNGLGAEFEGAAKSFGYQLEGGYRLFRVNEDGPWVEPLASLTYVRTDVDDLDMGGAAARFEDASSLRAALGLRLGGDLVMDAFTASFSATGRLWKEFDGDSGSTLAAAFGDTDLLDEGMDNLGDLGVAASFFTLGGRLSAHLAYNMLFKEDYQNTGASFGLRYNW